MSSNRELRARMTAVGKIGQVTRAMKLVASARYRKALAVFNDARPYTEALAGLAARFVQAGAEHAFLKPSSRNRVLILAVASDRGLCGSFNVNIIRQAKTLAATFPSEATISYAAFGRKASDAFRMAGVRVDWSYTRVQAKQFEAVALELAERLTQAFCDGLFDEIWIVHGGYESALVQSVRCTQLLPLTFAENAQLWPAQEPDIIEPARNIVVDALLPYHLRAQSRWALLEAEAAEQAARMVVMDQASRNADDLVDQLLLEWNKARQDSITSELADITTGAEAVR